MPGPMGRTGYWHIVDAVVRAATLLGAFAFVVVYLDIAIHRVDYPFPLEWMEGGVLEHMFRVLERKPLYVTPSWDFTPFIYPPLYFELSASVARGLGQPGFLPMRAVSIVASLGCMATIAALVWVETRSRYCAFFAGAFFAAMFRIGGAWLDLARVDSLFLWLILSTLLGVRTSRRWQTDLALGALGALAFLTKQTTLVVLLPVCVYCLVCRRGWRRVAFPATLGAVMALSVGWLDQRSDGWFRYYAFVLPAQHQLEPKALLGFWHKDLMALLPIACGAGLTWLLWYVAQRRGTRGWFWLAAAAGLLAGAWSSRLHTGGYVNVLLPAYAFVAIAFGMSLAALRAAPGLSQLPPATGAILSIGGHLTVMIQLVMLAYDPSEQIPTPNDHDAGNALVQKLHEIEGDVMFGSDPYFLRLAGKPTHAHRMAVDDVIRSHRTPVANALRKDVRKRIERREFGAAIVDAGWFAADLKKHYTFPRSFAEGEAFQFATGWNPNPNRKYTPRSSSKKQPVKQPPASRHPGQANQDVSRTPR